MVRSLRILSFLKQNFNFKKQSVTRIIVCSFAAVILIGALLLMLPISSRDGTGTPLLHALFTATSATCVTGLVVYDTYTQFSVFGQWVILLLIQIGGLGLVTLTTFFNVAIGRRLGFKSLRLASESINLSDPGQAKSLLKFVMMFAFVFEAVGAVLLSFVFIPQFGAEGIFIAVFTSISAFCNAGFDILGRLVPGASLRLYAQNPYVLAVVSLLIISGGLGFVVWNDLAAYREKKHLRTHTKLVLLMTVILLVIGTIGVAVLEWNNPETLGKMPWYHRISNAMFASVTARTAGFDSFDMNLMGPIAKTLIILLMFIGAAPGGTGGGIKVTTISVIMVAVASVARGREEVTVFSRRIDYKTVYRSLTIMTLSLGVVVVSTLSIFYGTSDKVSELNALFEAVSAFATVGLTVGATADMNAFAQIVTIVTMLIGRVGPVSMAISLAAHPTDRNMHRSVSPQAHISVG